ASDRLGSGRCAILRIVRHDEEAVPRILLGQERTRVLIEAFIKAADRKDHGDGRQERPEGEADPPPDPAAQPDSLEDRRHAREGRQGREERQPNPKEVQRHRRANLRVRNKPWRYAPTRTSSPSMRTSNVRTRAIGFATFAPVRTSYSHPWFGHVTTASSRKPSPIGPPRWRHTFETAQNRPSTLNSATGWPWATPDR